MHDQERQPSYASSDGMSIYSQSEREDGDHSTIGDTENPPAATSDEHLGASETNPEKAQSLSDDNDPSLEDDLSIMLMNLKDEIAEKLVYATNIARSMESQHPEPSNDAKLSDLETKLAETERSRNYEVGRKGLYKDLVKELTNINKSLVAENGDLTTKANTLTAENKAARERAMEIFG
jgi:hypothetical protein